MDITHRRTHALRSNSSPPRAVAARRIGKLTIFVILPSEAVCTIRNVPYPVSVDWIECQLELMCGVVSEICTLHYPDGSNMRKDKNLLLEDRSQNVIVLRLRIADSCVGLWESVCRGDWGGLKKNIYTTVLQDVDSEFDKQKFNQDKYFYALFLACSLGRYQLCQKILTEDPAVNKATRFGHTCLHAAVCGDRSAIVDLLLRYQVDVNPCNALGQTPLQTAISKSAKRCCQKLRFVQYHRRSKQLHPQPMSTSHMVKNEEAPETRTNRARELFNKYGIKETTTKAWAAKQTPASTETTPRQGDIPKRKTLCHAGFTMDTPQTEGIPDTRRASSAATPSKSSNCPSRLAQRTSVDLGNLSHWKRIPRAGILLQRSFSEYQSSIGFTAPPSSPAFGNKMKVVDFRTSNQPGCHGSGHGPHPSPESPPTSPEVTETAPDDVVEDETNTLEDLESRLERKYDRQSSRGTQSSLSSLRCRPEGDRLSPKPPIRGTWVSMKRKLRLAILQTRAQKTKSGQNEAAFRSWLEKKTQEKLTSQLCVTDDSGNESSDENSVNEAFQKWLENKKNAPQNQRIFRGKYKSVFSTGSTMIGEVKHPDSMENKDAYKNWLRSRDVRALKMPVKQANAFKDVEAQRKQMLTNSVTYEEWMDAKYLRDRFSKDVKPEKVIQTRSVATRK